MTCHDSGSVVGTVRQAHRGIAYINSREPDGSNGLQISPISYVGPIYSTPGVSLLLPFMAATRDTGIGLSVTRNV